MINHEEKMKESKQFTGEDDCFIHVEMKDGHCERLMAGDGLAIIHGLCGAIDRFATLSKTSFDATLQALKAWHDMEEITKEEE